MDPIDSKPSFLAAIMIAARLFPSRRKASKRPSASWVGLSGALGRCEVRHCSTWNIAEEGNLPVARRSTFAEIARRRRQEGARARAESTKPNAFLHR